MLEKFYLKNYRNLYFDSPIYFNEITGIYGICASGKSNFCKALGDILITQPVYNVDNDRDIFFYYTFRYGEENVEIQYRRNKSGVICFARFIIKYLKEDIECISMLKSRNIQVQLVNIRENMLESGNLRAVFFVDKLIKEIENMWIFMNGDLNNPETGYHAFFADVSTCYVDKRDESDCFENVSMIICDDIDLQSDFEKKLMREAQSHQVPVVYTTRRTEQIEKWCKKVEDCGLILGGRVVKAKDASNKDLRTLKRLICFLETQSLP